MNPKKESLVLLLALLITAGVISGGLWWLLAPAGNRQETKVLDDDPSENVSTDSPDPEPSRGERILIQADSTVQKQVAVEAIASQNYAEAESLLEQSLSKQRNDPEALIYLNNARIGDNQAYTIAISVPIGTELTTAQEMLRGVAQAQSEINDGGGINGIPLEVVII